MENEMNERNEKIWVSTDDRVDIYHMYCPLDCGCIAICKMWPVTSGANYNAECPSCGDVTETAWSQGGEE